MEQSTRRSKHKYERRRYKKLKNYLKCCGSSDAEGQISQIELTEEFLEVQIQDAIQEKKKTKKLYQKLGTIGGLALVIILAKRISKKLF